MTQSPASALVAFCMVATTALIVVSGCRTVQPAARLPREPAVSASEFVGSEACAECHKSEFDHHSRTHHAATLRPAALNALGADSPPSGPIPNGPFELREASGKLTFAR